MNASKPITKKISASELRELEARSFVGRSDVYRYLRKNYPHLLSQKIGTGEGPSWDDVAAVLSKRGYVSSRGDPLNGHAVRRVFRRVEQDLRCKEVAAASQPTRPSPPARQRPDWQPPVAAVPQTVPPVYYRGEQSNAALPPRKAAATPPSQGPPVKSDPMTIDDLSPEARAKVERLRRTLEDDGRKKFGHF